MASFRNQPSGGTAAPQQQAPRTQHRNSEYTAIPIDPDMTDGENASGREPDLLELSVKFAQVDYESTEQAKDILVHRGDTMKDLVEKSQRLANLVQQGFSIAVASGRMTGPQDSPVSEWELCKERFPPAEASIYERWHRGAALPAMTWSATTMNGSNTQPGRTTAQSSSERVRALRAIYRRQAPAIVTEGDVDRFLERFPPLRPLLSAHVRLQRMRDAGDLPQLLQKQREDAEWRATRLAMAQVEEELHALMSQAQRYKSIVERNLRVLQHRMHTVGGAAQEAAFGLRAIKMEEDALDELLEPPRGSYEQGMILPAPPSAKQHVQAPTTRFEPQSERSLSVSSAPPTAAGEKTRSHQVVMHPSDPGSQFISNDGAQRGSRAQVAEEQHVPGDVMITPEMTPAQQPFTGEDTSHRPIETSEATDGQDMGDFLDLRGGTGNEDEDEDTEEEEELDASETVAMVQSSPDGQKRQSEQMVQQLTRSQSPSPLAPGQPFPMQTQMEVPDQLKAVSRGMGFSMGTERRTEMTTQHQMQTQTQTETSSAPDRGAAPRGSRQSHDISARDDDGGNLCAPVGSHRDTGPFVEIETRPSSQPVSHRRGGPAEAASPRKKSKKNVQASSSRESSTSPLTSADNEEGRMDEDKENDQGRGQRSSDTGHGTRSHGGKAPRSRGHQKSSHGISDLTNTSGGANRRPFQPSSK